MRHSSYIMRDQVSNRVYTLMNATPVATGVNPPGFSRRLPWLATPLLVYILVSIAGLQ